MKGEPLSSVLEPAVETPMVGKSVITLDDLSIRQIQEMLHKAQYIDSHRKEVAHTCEGRVLATLFYEPSTRTRLSFETAMLRLPATEQPAELFSDAEPDALTADIAALLSRFAAAGIVIDTARPQPPALRLTEREQQTLRLIADGYSNKGVARELGISAETVKWHLKQLYEKLQVKGRIQAVNQAREWRLLS